MYPQLKQGGKKKSNYLPDSWETMIWLYGRAFTTLTRKDHSGSSYVNLLKEFRRPKNVAFLFLYCTALHLKRHLKNVHL